MPELRDKTGGEADSSEKKKAPLGLIISAALILAILGATAAIVVPQLVNDDSPAGASSPPAGHAQAQAPAGRGDDAALFPAPPERDRFKRVMLVAGDDYPFGRTLDQQPDAITRGPSEQPGGLILMKYLRSSTWVSATDGPATIDEHGVPHSFAHTPQGAALAAAWGLYTVTSNLDVAAAAIDQGFLLTGGEQVDPAARSKLKGQSDTLFAPMAFDVDWNPRLTRVSMAVTTAEGKWIVTDLDVEWRNGDWAVRAHSATQTTVAALGPGFVQWQAGQ